MAVIIVEDAQVNEEQGFVDIVIRLSEPSTTPVSVSYDTDSQTAGSSDYGTTSGSVTFAPGETIKTVRVSIAADTINEGFESFTFYLFNPSGANLGRSTALITIVDNDSATGTPVVTISDPLVDEAGGVVRFIVTLDRPSASTVSMSYATANGTAQAGSDYSAVSGNISFAPGQMTRTIEVPLNNDSTAESAESFSLLLSNVSGASVADGAGTAIIAASDQAAVIAPVISVGDAVASEGQGFIEFTVRLNAPSTTEVRVAYAIGSFNAGTADYGDTSGTLSFAPGETVRTVRVAITADTTFEGAESFFIELFNPSGGTIGNSSALATIFDNDGTTGSPVVRVSDPVIDEGAGVAIFEIILDRASAGAVTVTYATANGTATAGSDFAATTGTIVFPAGQTVRTVSVPLSDDALAEGAETFSLQLTGATGATLTDTSGDAIIGASDQLALIAPAISVDDVIVGEGQAFAEFIVRLNAPSNDIVRVSYGIGSQSAGTADYEDSGGALVFAPGETMKIVRIALDNDTSVESLETFFIELFNPDGGTIANSAALATIIDNDAASGTPTIRIGDRVADEADGFVRFEITLDRPSATAVTVSYATEASSAQAGSDFTAASGMLTFAPGETARTILIPLANDSSAEAIESFSLLLSNAVNATLPDRAGVAILAASDQSAVIAPTISVDDAVIGEGQGVVEFTIRLSAPSNDAVRVSYDTGSQTAGTADYGNTGGFVVFAPGETVQTVRVTIANDSSLETLESFYLELFNPVGGIMGRSAGLATIVDNDATAGVPAITVGDALIDEAAGFARFEITLDRPSTAPVAVNYATVNGTAQAGSDFLGVSGSIVFHPGETARVVIVPLLDDGLAEGAEALALVLSGAANASFADATGIGFLAASDQTRVVTPTISVEDVVVSETQGYAEFTVRLNAPTDNDVRVAYSTSSQTASSADFGTTSGVLAFAPGMTTQTVRVAIANDLLNEALESFSINLSNASGGTIGNSQAVATIVDNDGGTASTPVNRSGGSGNDLFAGSMFADILTGNGGDDVLDGRGGADELRGGVGNDLYVIDVAGDDYRENAGEGVDTVISSLASTTLPDNIENLYLASAAASGTGNALDNLMIGAAGNDNLSGLGGNDTLDGGAGADQLTGGLGNDSYVVDDAGDLVFESAGQGTDSVSASVSHYLYANVDNLTLTGSGNIFGVGNELANVLTGNAGENLLIAGAGIDTVRGGAARDAIFGEGGDDALFGEAGIDYIVAGIGNDSVDGGIDADEIYGEAGDDVLNGGASFHTDIIVGGDGNDTIRGDSGLGDFDFLYGNAGNDIFHVDTPADLVFEQTGEGTDTVFANINGAGFYLYDNIENLTLLGSTPFGVGNALANTITGNAQGNYLLGGAGNDVLNGLGGGDVLFGEGGADTFVFGRGTGGDVIGDYVRGTDKIDLRAFGFSSFAQLQSAFVQNGGDGAIILGNGDLVVLQGVTMNQLVASDFIL